VAALLLSGTPLSILVFIGLIVLAGIVVNNAIVLVDYVNQLRRDRGLARDEAVALGARVRLRPILMTTLTTVLALVPMAFGLGEGGELRQPLAITVVAGLLSATLLTLVVIPVVYTVTDDLIRRLRPA
jgi:HAE1 family hydrophobic/amphiphilic exporter-1